METRPLIASIAPIDIKEFGLRESSRILVAEAINVTPHIETSLEIAIRLAVAGVKVDYLFYGHRLPYVEYRVGADNIFIKTIERLAHKLLPEDKANNILRQTKKEANIKINVCTLPFFITSPTLSLHANLLEDIDRLLRLEFRSTNQIGQAVVSSLVTATKDPGAIPQKHKDLCFKLIKSYMKAWRIGDLMLSKANYDAAVVFNGRFACVKGFVQAAEERKVPLLYHERGSSSQKFFLKKYQPHNNLEMQKDIARSWMLAANHKTKAEESNSFFVKSKNGVETSWTSFTAEQIGGLAESLVEPLRIKSSSGKLIVFYTSSEDEFVAIGDAFKKTVSEWKTQAEAVKCLASVASDLGHSLIIRIHPHISSKAARELDEWNNLTFAEVNDNTMVIPSNSPISSYELMELSDVVVTYGSTIGIESVYWGRPSIVMSDCFYDRIDAAVLRPRSVKELRSLLISPDKLPTNPSSAMPYGYFMNTYGIDYEIYKPEDLFHGNFLGVSLNRLEASIASKVGTRAKHILQVSAKLLNPKLHGE